MKKLFVTLILGTFVLSQTLAQATLPRIIIRPGKSWLRNNGYISTEDNQGQVKETFDYIKALDDPKMQQSIAELKSLLKNEGFEDVKDLGILTESINDFAAEEMHIEDENGNIIQKSEVDLMRERAEAEADMFLDISWHIEKIGPKKQLTYTVDGTDIYTGNDICTITGLGEPSMAASEATLLREAVIGKIPELKERLETYLTNMLEKGRRVYIGIRVSSSSNVHLQTPIEGGNIGRVIQKWILNNSVQHRASAGRSSRTSASYNANIPLYDSDGLPMNTDNFVWLLSDYLSAAPYNIQTSVENQGLGRALLIINGK